jgi:hypothetical protein
MSAPANEPLGISSVFDEAHQEAERHKWIESQKHGRDLGQTAIREWYRKHWPRYCRFRRIEHLQGRRRWREFREDEFGFLYSLIVSGDLLTDRILDRVDAGQENLGIINWAIDWGLPLPRVREILKQVDVNRSRLDPEGAE